MTGYYVERRTTESRRWVKITKAAITETTLEVKDLIEGSEYEFRVTAVNKVGESEPGPSSKTVKAKDPWGEFIEANFIIVFPNLVINTWN